MYIFSYTYFIPYVACMIMHNMTLIRVIWCASASICIDSYSTICHNSTRASNDFIWHVTSKIQMNGFRNSHILLIVSYYNKTHRETWLLFIMRIYSSHSGVFFSTRTSQVSNGSQAKLLKYAALVPNSKSVNGMVYIANIYYIFPEKNIRSFKIKES